MTIAILSNLPNVVLGTRLEMLVFRLVLLVNWFDCVNAGRTSEMRVTWEVCTQNNIIQFATPPGFVETEWSIAGIGTDSLQVPNKLPMTSPVVNFYLYYSRFNWEF